MIPSITTTQMIEVDRAMIEDYHIELIQMMENAGRAFAELARSWLGGTVTSHSIVILCGSGNNGGGGMTAARHLHNWGANVIVAITKSAAKLQGIPAHQLDILRRMEIPILDPGAQRKPLHPSLILDAIIGYSLSGSPQGVAADLIRWANGQEAPVLALDTPSGLDVTGGVTHDPAIRANATLTLALPKQGLLNPRASSFVGELYVADISIPPELYKKMGISVPPLFERQDIVRIKLQESS